MHDNANVVFNLSEANTLLNSIVSLQPRTAGGQSANTTDDVVLGIANVLSKQLPDYLKEEDAGAATFSVGVDGCLPPLGTVLKQEIAKFNRLLERCNTSLLHLKKAVQGLAVMSQVGWLHDL